ncbi:DUF692 domain-containing protein [Vibrio caribbeanicus]|uniref:UPF0276 protein VIBC2010_03612 n=1 Tax=Vibrio caribbeanicus ATCC BAA-2122 TaxID=796620 RepID=E3BL66_9VIBR|nr:DUF692 domain-containing protein [Vibrio caribbeanicus]EFP96162.1 hypothetical protein VIBC2010_03612 [Vibrio caribbeanicus ATCC BAA-2122]MCY9846382.1 DUF692 domain-containing protein [Vibrio caribbeanicus]
MTLSFGLGLRTQHYNDFLNTKQPVDWLEVISDNYMVNGGKPLAMLDRIRADYPVTMHGVSMSIGSVKGLDQEYLKKLKALEQRIQPMWVSDHLCWGGVHGRKLHDLMPLPFTQEALEVVSRNIRHAQDFLQRPLVIENVSSYVEFKDSEMTEWDFLSEICNRTGCQLLLDINNIYVSAFNHGFSPFDFIDSVPSEQIRQFHLAGHQDNGDHLIDTHDHPVCHGVWELYEYALHRFGSVPTMIERDDNIPPLSELLEELETAKAIASKVLKIEGAA